ncbi:hypothetical protein [Lactiplantibacillus fabifermentans]|uniref:Uncharacterized protein n=1 Tax=Lactiplantibacillus fabifermentans T30PCM01 TaxID=1400520 RepID=W6T6Z2_9LACO|nr:hypothetical protein [Lactiplantibacillus fabifermentans]ETY73972.1 hypothetical protein LFAB_09530 [Lactiplantibacillus fabifermentans T30PCM01]
MLLLTIYGSLKMAIRLVIYLVLGGLVIFMRYRHRKKTRKRIDKGTERLMAKTPKDENGKYPWEK